MNAKLKAWLCGVALAGAAAMSLASWAMGPPEGMQPDPARMLAHMSKQLDLSDEQQTQVKSLLAEAKQANAADRERMQELRSQMKGMRDNFDAVKAREIADEIGQVTGRMVYRASDTWSQVYQLLNAEQRMKLDGMMERDRGPGKRHGEGGKPPL